MHSANLVELIEDSLIVKFCQNRFSGCGEEVEKYFRQSDPRAVILDARLARKTQTWSKTLRTSILSSFVKTFMQRFRRRVDNVKVKAGPLR